MFRKIFVLVIVIMIATGVFFITAATAVPDVNTSTGSEGESAVGYMDVSVTVTFGTQGTSLMQAEVTEIVVIEYLSTPSVPVTTIYIPGLTTSACTAHLRMYVNGHGMASVSQETDTRGFSQAGGKVTWSFGHIYVFLLGGQYSFTIEVYIDGCGSYAQPTFVESHPFTVTFDGE